MAKPYDLSKPLVALDHDGTLVAVIEMSGASWLVSAVVPGIDRRPLQKPPVDEGRLLARLERRRSEAAAAGKPVARVVVGFEAGRDGLWLARWLRARGVEAHPIHPSGVAVPREARRAKTDRLDTAMPMRGLLGWLRGEPDHRRVVAVPTAAEEDARRPGREREHLVGERTRVINRLEANPARLGIRGFDPRPRKAAARLGELRTAEGEPIPPRARAEMERDLERLDLIRRHVAAIEEAREEAPAREPEGPNAMVPMLAEVRGVGVETADMPVREVISRGSRDRRALARLAGLTGTPDESGAKRRQKGIGKAGVARVRRGLIQLAWRLLRFRRGSALVRWYEARTAGARGAARKTFLVALARKPPLALTRYATLGELPEGFVLNPARGTEDSPAERSGRRPGTPGWMVRRKPPLGDDPIERMDPSSSEPRMRCAWRVMVPAPMADRMQGCLAAWHCPEANVRESSAPETPTVTEMHSREGDA